MAVKSTRETILEYIRLTTMPKINGVTNYNLELATISRNFMIPAQLKAHDYPAVFIIDDFSTSYTEKTANEYTTGNSIDSTSDGMIITLIAYVKTEQDIGFNKEGKLSTEMNKIYSDMMVAMHTDRSLNGNCLSLSVLSSVNSLEFLEEDIGTVLQTYAIKYDFNPTGATPTT